MDSAHIEGELVDILFTEEQIQAKLAEMAKRSRPTTRARTSSWSASCAAPSW